MHTETFLNNQFKKTLDIINDINSDINEIVRHINKYTDFNKFIIKLKNNETDSKTLLTKLFSKADINIELFLIIIDEINKIEGNYKKTYCNEYKLFMILQLEDNINKWKALQKLLFYSPNNKKSRHYETLRSQFQRWCCKGIFKKAFVNLLPYEKLLCLENNSCIKELEFNNELYIVDILKDFFIDSTMINNLRGSENIIINPELKKKKVTKITEISDVDGFVVSVCFNNPMTKKIKFYNEDIIINTAKNDRNCINETFNNSNITLEDIYLIGDKGYKIKDNNNINYKVITPNKKNQKKRLINRHLSKKMNFRHIVENSINGWKHKERINLRKDKKIITFSGWVYLSLLNHNLNINKIKKEIYTEEIK